MFRLDPIKCCSDSKRDSNKRQIYLQDTLLGYIRIYPLLLSIYLSIYLSISLYLPIYPSTSISIISNSTFLAIYLLIFSSIYLYSLIYEIFCPVSIPDMHLTKLIIYQSLNYHLSISLSFHNFPFFHQSYVLFSNRPFNFYRYLIAVSTTLFIS